jgi:hypothetical protein
MGLTQDASCLARAEPTQHEIEHGGAHKDGTPRPTYASRSGSTSGGEGGVDAIPDSAEGKAPEAPAAAKEFLANQRQQHSEQNRPQP